MMRRSLAGGTGLLAAGCGASAPAELSITLSELRDRIEGGWARQMVGVVYGFPTEFVYNQRLVPEDEMPEWAPDMAVGDEATFQPSNSFPQED